MHWLIFLLCKKMYFRGTSNEYPQRMFSWSNIKSILLAGKNALTFAMDLTD